MNDPERLTWLLPIPKRASERDAQTAILIGRCLAGDEFGYQALYQLYAADIFRLCFSLLQHELDAEEVLQDSFEYAFRRLDAYQPKKASFRTWLYKIAISRCRNKRRRKQLATFSLQRLSGDCVQDEKTLDPLERVALSETQETVMTALDRLTPKLREVVVLRYYGGMAYAEIGMVLGISPKTVESRMRLARMKLRVFLGASRDESDGE